MNTLTSPNRAAADKAEKEARGWGYSEEVDMAIKLGFYVNDNSHCKPSFINGDRHVWRIRGAWQSCVLIDGHYRKHKPCKDFVEAINRTYKDTE